jgi:cob(I)alamin adenosyltransferase
LECYGTLDELNACIGLIHSQVSDTNLSYYKQLSSFGAELQSIQQQLFAIGFAISDQAPLTQDMIQNLEISIDDTRRSHHCGKYPCCQNGGTASRKTLSKFIKNARYSSPCAQLC